MKTNFATRAAPTLIPAAFLALLALAGCGSGDSTAPTARAAGRAVAAHDGDAASAESAVDATVRDSAATAPGPSRANATGTAQPSDEPRSEPHVRFPLTVTDGLGRTVTLKAPPTRLVSLSPKNTELVFAVGAGDKLVGVTTFCNKPPAAAELPKVGGFSSHSISLETMVSLRPDLVLTAGEFHHPIIDQMERLGVPAIALAAESIGQLYVEIELLGRITDRQSEAAELIASMRRRIQRVQERIGQIPRDERVTVFYQVWAEPLSGAGPASFIGELIEKAGGQNILSDRSQPYTRISEEILMKRNPDVIVTLANGAARIHREEMLNRPSWSGLRAVRNRRVYVLDDDLVSRCGPRVADALETLAQQLYPAHFQSVATPETTGDGNPRSASP